MYVRTRLRIVRVGVGETIKRKGGVSQACLAKSTSFTLDIHNMVMGYWSVAILF